MIAEIMMTWHPEVLSSLKQNLPSHLPSPCMKAMLADQAWHACSTSESKQLFMSPAKCAALQHGPALKAKGGVVAGIDQLRAAKYLPFGIPEP